MFTTLGRTTLTLGESMDIGRVHAPDDQWGPRLLDFLEHKGEPWRDHLALALKQPLDALQTSCYVGIVEGEPACHIMIASSGVAVLLGHVYTRPDHRRKGAIRLLMRYVIDDCAGSGSIDVIGLSTEFGSPAYAIYESFGFRSAVGNGGSMILELSPGVIGSNLRRQPVSIRPLEWGDWPWINLIGMLPNVHEHAPRSIAMGLAGPGTAEGGFLRFMLRNHPSTHATTAFALVSASNATVGWSTLTIDDDGRWLPEAYAAPNFMDHCPNLLAALSLSR